MPEGPIVKPAISRLGPGPIATGNASGPKLDDVVPGAASPKAFGENPLRSLPPTELSGLACAK